MLFFSLLNIIHPHTHFQVIWNMRGGCLDVNLSLWNLDCQTQFRNACMFVIFQINITECYNIEAKETFKWSYLKARQTERARGEVKKGWRGRRRQSSGEFLLWWCFRLNVTAGTQTLDWCCVGTDVTPAHRSVSLRPSLSSLSLFTQALQHLSQISLLFSFLFSLFAGQHCTDIPQIYILQSLYFMWISWTNI